MAEKKKAASKKSPAKKQAAPAKGAAKKSSVYCVHMVKPGNSYKFEPAGDFSTKEEAEAYVAANPQWPGLKATKA
tara:strand:+ start:298 stop:522 length:225 start_codon:yes stop_codon:yes gene_type:complete